MRACELSFLSVISCCCHYIHVLQRRFSADIDSTHGPLIHRRQADKVIEHVEDAVSKGAKILVGGERGELGYVQPTVLANVSTDCVSTFPCSAQLISSNCGAS